MHLCINARSFIRFADTTASVPSQPRKSADDPSRHDMPLRPELEVAYSHWVGDVPEDVDELLASRRSRTQQQSRNGRYEKHQSRPHDDTAAKYEITPATPHKIRRRISSTQLALRVGLSHAHSNKATWTEDTDSQVIRKTTAQTKSNTPVSWERRRRPPQTRRRRPLSLLNRRTRAHLSPMVGQSCCPSPPLLGDGSPPASTHRLADGNHRMSARACASNTTSTAAEYSQPLSWLLLTQLRGGIKKLSAGSDKYETRAGHRRYLG